MEEEKTWQPNRRRRESAWTTAARGRICRHRLTYRNCRPCQVHPPRRHRTADPGKRATTLRRTTRPRLEPVFLGERPDRGRKRSRRPADNRHPAPGVVLAAAQVYFERAVPSLAGLSREGGVVKAACSRLVEQGVGREEKGIELAVVLALGRVWQHVAELDEHGASRSPPGSGHQVSLLHAGKNEASRTTSDIADDVDRTQTLRKFDGNAGEGKRNSGQVRSLLARTLRYMSPNLTSVWLQLLTVPTRYFLEILCHCSAPAAPDDLLAPAASVTGGKKSKPRSEHCCYRAACSSACSEQ